MRPVFEQNPADAEVVFAPTEVGTRRRQQSKQGYGAAGGTLQARTDD